MLPIGPLVFTPHFIENSSKVATCIWLMQKPLS